MDEEPCCDTPNNCPDAVPVPVGVVEIKRQVSACVHCGSCNDTDYAEGLVNVNHPDSATYDGSRPTLYPLCCLRAQRLFGLSMVQEENRMGTLIEGKLYIVDPETATFKMTQSGTPFVMQSFDSSPHECRHCKCTHWLSAGENYNHQDHEDIEFYVCAGCGSGASFVDFTCYHKGSDVAKI